jgi:putative PEP-CTERM system TPR-repeat lipoprotein
MMTQHSGRLLPAIAITCAVVTLVACGKSDPSAFIASAKSYIAIGGTDAAVIQLKSALQESPDNAEARFLLGKALVVSNPVNSEVELRKALALNYPPDEVAPTLARALLGQGEFRKLVLELGERTLANAAEQADLRTSVAIAYLALGETQPARSAVDSALAAKPNDPRALVVLAQLDAKNNDVPLALKHIETALQAAPDDLEAVVLKAQLQTSQGQRDQAISTLEGVISAKPQSSLNPRFVLVPLLLGAQQTDKAAVQVDAMKKLAPQDFRTLYSEALVSFARNDTKHARDVIQGVVAARPDNLQALYLSGLIDFQLESYAGAEESLRKVVAQASDPNARRVLAMTYLRTGRPALAIETVEEGLRQVPDNPLLLRVAGEAYLASGNLAKASQAYERANKVDKGDLSTSVRLAQVRFATGDTTRAFKDLESLSGADSTQYQADLALITAHLRQGEFDKALAAVKTLETKQPNNPLTYSLKGAVYIAMRDLKNARVSFEKALEMQPGDFNSARVLSLIDVQERKPEDARKRYEQLLAKDPKNEQLLLALAELLVITRHPPDEVKAAIDRAIAANPTSVRPRLALISYYMRVPDQKAALAAAQAARTAFPNDPQVLELLGVAQLASDPALAVDTFKQLVQMQPQNAKSLLRLAQAQMVVKDYDAAIDSLQRALSAEPDQEEIWVGLTRAYFVSGHTDNAVAEARKLQKQYPDRALGYALEGEVYAAQKKWPEAVSAYREGLARKGIPALAVRLYSALENQGNSADASSLATKWMKEHPKDTTFYVFLAERAQNKKDFKTAALNYRRALEIEPENPIFLNDLAWALSELGDAKATEIAEKAYRQAPYTPEVIDTLGWALVKTGDANRGVELLQAASNLAPTNNDIRMHLATGMIKTGNKAGAKRELEALTKLDKDSPIRADAEKMLSGL